MSLWTAFDSISSNIDEILSVNPSTNVFVFGDFNVHHKDCLTYSGGTDRPGELCYNFSITSDLTQIVNFPTWIPDCDSRSLALLYLFLSADVSIYSLVAFPPMGNSDHVVVSIPIDFPSNSKWDAFFYHIADDYSLADGTVSDHLKDVPWKDFFKLSALYQQNKSSESKDRLVIVAKGFLKLPNLHILIKQKVHHLTETWLLGLLGNC